MINYHQQYDINNNIKYQITDYKTSFSLPSTSCDGKGCNNIATNYLKIFYLKKPGFFCDTCKKEMEDLDLVENTLSNNNVISI